MNTPDKDQRKDSPIPTYSEDAPTRRIDPEVASTRRADHWDPETSYSPSRRAGRWSMPVKIQWDVELEKRLASQNR